MKFRHKGVSQIIAARKELLRWRERCPATNSKPTNPNDTLFEAKIDQLIKKEHFSNDDKLDVLNDIQKKYRIAFTHRFPIHKITLTSIHSPHTLEKCYDPAKKSYYLVRGKVSVLRYGEGKEEIIQGEKGVGPVFSDSSLKQAKLTADRALILQIPHTSSELEQVEYNILMTLKEKERAVDSFKLFNSVQSLHKHYLAFFKPLKFSKGDYIYRNDSQPEALFLIVQGEVAFETAIEEEDQEGKNQRLMELIRRKKKEDHLITEVLSSGSYFGEEEILRSCPRIQQARCHSLSCLLLSVPFEKVDKLITIPQFLAALQSSSQQRCWQRQRIVERYHKVKISPRPKQLSPEQVQSYQNFKQKLFTNISPEEEEQPRRWSLGRDKKKIMHGHSLKINRKSCEVEPAAFSMLEVNEQTYQKTIKRFRYSLKEIERQKEPKLRTELTEGRTLLQCWNALQLETVLDPEKSGPQAKIYNQDCNGLENYQAYARLAKQMKRRHSTRPKGFTTSCRLKQEYIKYLQELS